MSVANSKVRVILRVRPREDGADDTSMIRADSAGTGQLITVCSSPDDAGNRDEREFLLDDALSTDASQEQTFRTVTYPLVEQVVQGFNSTCVAYGQTGAGKTYTVVGESPETAGLVPRTADALFARLADVKDVEATVFVSFLEIYLDQVFDLLADSVTRPTTAPSSRSFRKPVFPGSRRKDGDFTRDANLEIHEDVAGLVYVKDLTMSKASTARDVFMLLQKGMSRRATFGTSMNERSSRSHTIFTMQLIQRPVSDPNQPTTTSVLNIVDLAGSERLRKSLSEGVRKKEAQAINRSLSALGNTVVALARGDSHIPYRDSKLTRLLQDSLGGNSFTTIVATVNPTPRHYEESLATVMFAHRCRNVKNTPTVNYLDVSAQQQEAQLKTLIEEVGALKSKLSERDSAIDKLKGLLREANVAFTDGTSSVAGSPAPGTRPDHSRTASEGDGSRGARDMRRMLATQRQSNVQLQKKLEARTEEIMQRQKDADKAERRWRADAAGFKRRIKELEMKLASTEIETARKAGDDRARHSEELGELTNKAGDALASTHRQLEMIPERFMANHADAASRDAAHHAEIEQARDECRMMMADLSADKEMVLIRTRERYETLMDHKQDELERFIVEHQNYSEKQAFKYRRMCEATIFYSRLANTLRAIVHEVQEGRHPAVDYMGHRAVKIAPGRIPGMPPGPMQERLVTAQEVCPNDAGIPPPMSSRMATAHCILNNMRVRPVSAYVATGKALDRGASMDHLLKGL